MGDRLHRDEMRGRGNKFISQTVAENRHQSTILLPVLWEEYLPKFEGRLLNVPLLFIQVVLDTTHSFAKTWLSGHRVPLSPWLP